MTQPAKRKPLNLSEKVAVLSRDALCPKCFKPYAGKVEFDHVQALSADGGDDVENLQPLCPKCHKSKTLVDNKRAKKNARLRGETGQNKRRKARERPLIQGNTKIPQRKDPWGKEYRAKMKAEQI